MLDVRILNENEYGLLDSLPEDQRVNLDGRGGLIAAAFDDGKLVGRLALVMMPHIEFLWFDPDYHKSYVADRLGIAMEELLLVRLKELGAKLVVAFAINETVEKICQRRGYEKFATAWRKEI